MPPVAIPTTSITSLSEFIELALSSQGSMPLFRGQSKSAWKLVPKLGRSTDSNLDVVVLERQLLDSFRSASVSMLDRSTADDWELLAVAQHFGLATRLLDWTTNPIAALWFAIKDPVDAEAAVWSFCPKADDYADRSTSPFSQSRTVVYQPSHLTERIVKQSGWFSVQKFNRTKSRLSTFDMVSAYRTRLSKLTVASRHVPRLRSELDQLGVNDAALFPDLDGLCRHLNWAVPQQVARNEAEASGSSQAG